MIGVYKLILYVLGLPKTLYFNFKYLNFRNAIKLPILVSHRVYLMDCQGALIIDAPIKFGMIQIGFGKVSIFDAHTSRSIWQVSGKVVFKGSANIGHGSKLSVGGILTLGANFIVTAESQIVCHEAITFGRDVLISWDNLFMDTDFHKLKIDGLIINSPREIRVGNHVWIGCRCTILKGTIIEDNIVVAAGSTVFGTFDESNSVIGGNPLRVLRGQVEWEY